MRRRSRSGSPRSVGHAAGSRSTRRSSAPTLETRRGRPGVRTSRSVPVSSVPRQHRASTACSARDRRPDFAREGLPALSPRPTVSESVRIDTGSERVMNMKIVVGVDGSEPSQRAVEWCATYAKALGAEVVAVHVVDAPLRRRTRHHLPGTQPAVLRRGTRGARSRRCRRMVRVAGEGLRPVSRRPRQRGSLGRDHAGGRRRGRRSGGDGKARQRRFRGADLGRYHSCAQPPPRPPVGDRSVTRGRVVASVPGARS